MANIYSQEITAKFLDKYKELEEIKEKDFKRFERFRNANYTDFELFRQTRNCLTHTPKQDGDFPFLISDETLSLLETYIARMSTKAYEVMTPISKMITIDLDTSARGAIRLMDRYGYSHLPVLDKNKRVTHVVSEKSIVSLLANTDETKEGLYTLKDFAEYFVIKQNEDEYYRFMARDDFAYHAKDIFNVINKHRKCGAIFVTENGDSKEAILGIISAWDVFNL